MKTSKKQTSHQSAANKLCTSCRRTCKQAANAVVGTVAASDAVGVSGFRFSANNSTTSADGYFSIAANGEMSTLAPQRLSANIAAARA